PVASPTVSPAARVRPAAPVPGDGPVRSPAELATILRDVGEGVRGPGRSPVAPVAGATAAVVDPEELIRRVGELPALPRVANHILALIADPNTTAGKLEKAIILDQALTAKILKIANSSFYGGLRDVNTVSEAIVRLGFVTIRNWTLVTAAKSVFLDAASGPALQQIWQQSVLSAMASQLVAEHVRHSSPESVFVGGLMQNIGQLALAKASPELFRQVLDTSADAQVPYHVVERELLGFDHGALGALLIREWNLSDELEEAVRTHHHLAEAGAARPLAAMIALGEEIAACSGSVPDEGLTIWEMSEAARLLDVPETTYVDLLEKARRLRIDPRLFG
ncbi:MAG: HDOD domain-containing protein, partial [Candidatus Krumholzibacteriia bacterium]